MNTEELIESLEKDDIEITTNLFYQDFKKWAQSLTEEQKNKLWESYGH